MPTIYECPKCRSRNEGGEPASSAKPGDDDGKRRGDDDRELWGNL